MGAVVLFCRLFPSSIQSSEPYRRTWVFGAMKMVQRLPVYKYQKYIYDILANLEYVANIHLR